tara:strand:- start:191 stop:499 length:309 start_codon:yes stop_codon:yes gene_type:complete
MGKESGANMANSIRLFVAILAILFFGLQYKAWFSDVGHLEVLRLSEEVEAQKLKLELLSRKNARLATEVLVYKEGGEALESRARSDLGMVKKDETFYLINDL